MIHWEADADDLDMDPILILGVAAVITVWVVLSLLGGERQRQLQIQQAQTVLRAASEPATSPAPVAIEPPRTSKAIVK